MSRSGREPTSSLFAVLLNFDYAVRFDGDGRGRPNAMFAAFACFLSCRKGRNTRIYSFFCLRTVHKAVLVGRKRHEALNRYLGTVCIRLVRGSNVRFVWVSYIDFLAGA